MSSDNQSSRALCEDPERIQAWFNLVRNMRAKYGIEGAEHVCRIVDCPAKPGTACRHIPAKCGTCGGPHSATAGNCPAKRAARKELWKRTTESKNIFPPAESPQRMTSPEPAIPSSPWFTVVNRGQYRSRQRSSSAPNSPQTQRYIGSVPTIRQEEDTEMRGTDTPGQSTPR